MYLCSMETVINGKIVDRLCGFLALSLMGFLVLMGTVVNNGSLHLVPTEHGDLKIGVDRDKFVNNGKVYYNGVLVPNERLFSEEEK